MRKQHQAILKKLFFHISKSDCCRFCAEMLHFYRVFSIDKQLTAQLQ